MTFKSIALALAASGLVVAPIAASAAGADRFSPVESANEVGGKLSATAIILALGALGMGILIISDDDDDDDAVST